MVSSAQSTGEGAEYDAERVALAARQRDPGLPLVPRERCTLPSGGLLGSWSVSLTVTVEVPAADREVLSSWTRASSGKAGLAQRARIVLLAADDVGTHEIVRRVGVSKPTVIAWKRRYAAEGLAGLQDRPKPGRPPVIDEARIVVRTLEAPPAHLGVTHWSSRLLAADLGLSNVTIARVWRKWTCSPGAQRRSSSPLIRS